METPVQLDLTLARPAVPAAEEPREPVFALLEIRPDAAAAVRPALSLAFVVDASASMHQFFLDPADREVWLQRARSRGEISQQQADGRASMVWTGQTLRELQQHVSTPMLSSLRGIWRSLESLDASDSVGISAFADESAVFYEDSGVAAVAERLTRAKEALTRLGGGADTSGLGRGTRLEGALLHALQRCEARSLLPVVHRMILISDGIIEDEAACRPMLDQAVELGLEISVIGVGDEFDEEALMRIADLTRGSYYYAASAPEVEQSVMAELEMVSRIAGREARLRIRPERGTQIHDVYPVSPSLAEFHTVWLEDGEWRFRIGDLSATRPPAFLLELAPAAHPAGEVAIGVVQVEGAAASGEASFAVSAPVNLLYTSELPLLQARSDRVQDIARRVEIYREERRAAEAAARGDRDAATKHLRTATRMLRSAGEVGLAEEMGLAADDSESGTRNLSRTKRVKAGTRRLGGR